MKNNLIQNSDQISEKKINWEDVQIVFKEKFGSEIFESWLKKIVFVEEYKNYLLLSVSTRFIRDWITSRYLDQILQIIKIQKKGIIRVEFIIDTVKDSKLTENKTDLKSLPNKNISFLKDSYLQYNRIDPNKNFENFVIGESNKLAFEASKKVSNACYSDKREAYINQSMWEITRKIGLDSESWTKKEIVQRSKTIADWAVTEWKF